jgi:hypothetical protein
LQTRNRKACLNFRREHFKLKPEIFPNLGNERLSVLGNAARLRRNHPSPRHAMALHLSRTYPERVHRAAHRVIRKTAGLADAFPQSNNARKGVHDTETAPRRTRQQQAAIVRSEIKCSVDRIAERAGIGL